MKTIFAFCPNCKSETINTENGHKQVCLDCNFQYFHNVAAAVMVVLQTQDELLFVRRNQNPSIGLLDLPGGFVDYNESAKDTVIRELKEELAIDLSQSEMIFFGSYPNQYLYKNVLYHTLDLAFVMTIAKEKNYFFSQEEIQELVWIKKNEIKLDHLAFHSTKKFIADLLI
jgi:NAD+ diphosphatase